jgi:hypothetical protein
MIREKYTSSFALGLTLGVLGYMSTARVDIRKFLNKPRENIKKEENTNFSEWIEQSYSIEDSRNWIVVYKATNAK